MPKDALNSQFDEFVLTEEEYLQGFGTRDVYAVILAIFLLIQDNLIQQMFVGELRAALNVLAPELRDEMKYKVFKLPTNFDARLSYLLENN